MIRVLSRLARSLGVESGEGLLFAWSAATLFLIGWASVSLSNVSETLFLKRVGVDRLPVVFLANSLLLVGTTYGMSRLAARRGRRRLLTRTFAGLGAFMLLLWLLLIGHAPGVFVLLVIASKQLDAIALIAFWMVLGSLLHGRQAKRIYAPIIAGGTLGRILGSFASGFIGNALGIAALLPVSAAAIGLACFLAARVGSAAPARLTHMTSPRKVATPPASLGTFAPLWRESRLFRLLVLGALFGGALAPMLYFQFSYIADLATRGSNGEMRLLDLYAKVRGFINVGVLAMQLVGTSRIFRRIGLPLAYTLSPLVYLAGFLGVSTRLDLPSGIGAVGGANLQDHAIQEPAQRVLVTLFPERLRAAATSLVEGPVQRTGGALGNLIVLGALALSTPASVGFAALPIAALWLAGAIALWRIYPTVLLEVASTERRNVEGLSLQDLVDPGTARVLERSLVDPDLRRCTAACELIVEAPLVRAVAALASAVRHAPAANRPLLVDTLHRLLRRTDTWLAVPQAAHHLEPLLSDAAALQPLERARLVEAYAQLLPSLQHNAEAARLLTDLLADPEAAVRLAANVQLHLAGIAEAAGSDLDDIVAAAFASDDAAVHEVALEALRGSLLSRHGGEHREARIALTAERLRHPADRVFAAETLAEVAARHGAPLAAWAEELLACVHDPDPRVRTAVLRFIGHAQLEKFTGWAIGRLASDDEAEAAEAASALLALGPRTMSALLDALHRDKRVIREAVFNILHHMPANVAALKDAIEGEIAGMRGIVMRIHGLRSGPVSELVLQRLDERIAEGLHSTLLLLATLLHEDRIAALARLLARSPDGRGRAPLLEALEALLPPGEAGRLIPLLEDGASHRLPLAAGRGFSREVLSFDEAVRETLADHDQLTHIFLVATLDQDTRARLGNGAGLAPGHELEHHRGPGDGGREDIMLKRVEIVLHLRTVDLFADLTTRELSELAGVVREEAYAQGTPIVREGESGDCMYVVVEGEVRVTREGKFVSRLKQGDFFGEMAIFDAEARFATVTAAAKLRLLRLERNDLLQLMDEQPGMAIAMCQTLSRRVRDLISRLEGRSVKDESEF